MKNFWLAIPALTLLVGIGHSQNNPTVQLTDERIVQLIKLLGSEKYAEREKATVELDAIGVAALPQLRLAAANANNLELSLRAGNIVKKIEDRITLEELLAPKKVTLSFKDTPVIDAVAELQKQSGYEIEVKGDQSPLQTRKITLETGETAFWQAFDKLCEVANLVDVVPHTDINVMSDARGVPSREPCFDPIVVRDGTPRKIPTSYHGALRIRTKASGTVRGFPVKEGETLLILEVTGEPRLRWFSVIQVPRVTKALDDQSQILSGNSEHPAVANLNEHGLVFGRDVPLYLSLGAKKAASVKELAGTFLVQAAPTMPEAFIVIDDIAKAIDKTVKGPKGGSIKIHSFEKNPNNGTYRVKIRFETPPSHIAANGLWGGIPEDIDQRALETGMITELTKLRREVLLNGGQLGPAALTLNQGLPILVDAKERLWLLESVSDFKFDLDLAQKSGQLVQERTMVFRPSKSAGPPTQMVLYGHRMVSARVPFHFENIPLL